MFLGLSYYAMATAVLFAVVLLEKSKTFCMMSVFPFALWMLTQLVFMPMFVLFYLSILLWCVMCGLRDCEDIHLLLVVAFTNRRPKGIPRIEMHGPGDTARVQLFNVFCQIALASHAFSHFLLQDGNLGTVCSTVILTGFMLVCMLQGAVLAVFMAIPLCECIALAVRCAQWTRRLITFQVSQQ
jgi:hypothetical protein